MAATVPARFAVATTTGAAPVRNAIFFSTGRMAPSSGGDGMYARVLGGQRLGEHKHLKHDHRKARAWSIGFQSFLMVLASWCVVDSCLVSPEGVRLTRNQGIFIFSSVSTRYSTLSI